MAANLSASEVDIKAVPMPERDALFQRADGWIGADGNYSIALDKDTVLWLFSDTFVGKVQDNHRIDTVMINNTLGIEHLGSDMPVEFFYPSNEDGAPASFVTPDDGHGYFWLFHGALTSKGLFTFLMHIEHSDENAGFPFRHIGVSLGHVPNPSDPPLQWHLTQTRVPFSRFAPKGSTSFGAATMKSNEYIYIYGVDSIGEDDKWQPNGMIVARVLEDKFGDFTAWRFWTGSEWGTNFEQCESLFSNVATEYSVSYVPGIGQYAVVYMEAGIAGRIAVRLSPKPEGPWGEPTIIFDCPDKDWHEKAFSYSAKAHPEISSDPNELIVTYATNSTHFPDLFDDARLYWPKFVRLTFASR